MSFCFVPRRPGCPDLPCFLRSAVILLLSALVSAGATLSNCDEASLRQAMSSGGTITFACDGTIALSTMLLVDRDTVLDGNGRQVTISGNGAVRVFEVDRGIRFTLRGLTIANGAVIGTNGTNGNFTPGGNGEHAFGAGVLNQGTLTVESCVFTNNVVRGGTGGLGHPPGGGGNAGGSAIYNDGGAVVCTNCTFLDNSAIGGRGGDSAASQSGGLGGYAIGGAFFSSSGTFALGDATFRNNSALGGEPGSGISIGNGIGGPAWGGAFASVGSTGTVFSTQFISNRAKGAGSNLAAGGSGAPGGGVGGALYNTNAFLTIARSLFSSNVAETGRGGRSGLISPPRGGAVLNFGTMTVSDTHFYGNVARVEGSRGDVIPAFGGAVANEGTARIMGCTFYANQALGGPGASTPFGANPGGAAFGGAVYSVDSLAISNSTLVANRAQGGSSFGQFGSGTAGIASGGGLALLGNTTLSHVTIASNVALNGASPSQPVPLPGRGGGIYATNNAPTLQNSIVAGNVTGSNAFGVLTDEGNNISSDGSCEFTQPGSRNNVDPRLSPLADFGGPTPTMALLAGSPAIDAALSSRCVPTDQRGRVRPAGPACDVGAFESSAPFTVRGTISGKPQDGITVQCNSVSGSSDSAGNYVVFGVSPGNHNIVPTSPDAVVIPNSRALEVSSDLLDIDFKAYPFNGLTVDAISNQDQTVVLAGQSGDRYEVQQSQAIAGPWTNLSTNTVGPNGIVTFQAPLSGATSYLRARRLSP